MAPSKNKRRRGVEIDTEEIHISSDDITYIREEDIILQRHKKPKITEKISAVKNCASSIPSNSLSLPEFSANFEEPATEEPMQSTGTSAHKTASELLNDMKKCMPIFLRGLIALETPLLHSTIPLCMRCSTSPGRFQCPQCHLSPLLCQECIVDGHASQPFHPIDEFVEDMDLGTIYRRKSNLFDLGLIVHLGHAGLPCPSLGSPSDMKTLVVVHTNGIHKTRFRYCTCDPSPLSSPLYQLVISRLFPATTERPQTVFTHQLLEEFCQHTHEAGTTPYAYFAAIRRLTDNVIWENVQDRYREFMRAGRVWRHLKDELRSGEFAGLQKFLPSCYQHCYAVLCPACPQVGINMSAKYLEDVKVKPHKHKFFAAIDGNFRQTLTNKPHDPDDFALSNGKCFFVEEHKYRKYLESVQDTPELSTCTGFKAGDVLRQNRIKGLVVTGIVAVSCSRHNMIRPQGVVDLYYGERYSNVDYAVASTLGQYLDTSVPIELAYDIACKYGINFDKRMNDNFPDINSLLDRISFLVPSMHIKAHEMKCQKKFMRDFAPYTGKCDAEGAERIWSELNQWATSTSEMNPGHRHDIINDNVNDWNWRKLVSIGTYLVDRWLMASKQRRRCKWEFDDFTAATSEELITYWKTLPVVPIESPDGKTVTSVFFPDERKVPTQAEIRLAVLEEDKREGLSEDCLKQAKVALHDALVFALDLEQSQMNTIRMHDIYTATPTDANAVTLHSMRKSVQSKLNLWRQYQNLHLPCTSVPYSCPSDSSEAFPENAPLGLPSSKKGTEQLSFDLRTAALLERRLRETYAYATINDLKQSLALKAANLDARRRHAVGQKNSTRAQKVLESLNETIRFHIKTYERHRAALISLGLPTDDTTFQPLKLEHCTLAGLIPDDNNEMTITPVNKVNTTQPNSGKSLKRTLTKAAKNKGSRKGVSWIWLMGYAIQTGKEMTDWDVEFRRTQWFILRARKDRWHEEVEILEEEMRRVTRFFKFWEDAWTQLVIDKLSDSDIIGIGSYATKMVHMYRALYENVRQKFPKDILDESSPTLAMGPEAGEEELEEGIIPLGMEI